MPWRCNLTRCQQSSLPFECGQSAGSNGSHLSPCLQSVCSCPLPTLCVYSCRFAGPDFVLTFALSTTSVFRGLSSLILSKDAERLSTSSFQCRKDHSHSHSTKYMLIHFITDVRCTLVVSFYWLTSVVPLIVRGFAIGADILVLALTWWRTADVWKLRRRATKLRLTSLLFRDGKVFISRASCLRLLRLWAGTIYFA